jgi:peptidoglycan/xylan/chitin deacetylase (PgdA/CDA1 family)
MINFLTSITKKKIVVPFYHTVAERPLPHIRHLYRMKTVAEFQKDLDFLLKHFEPIDAETLHHLHIHKTVPKKPVFHLTFDDGLREMFDIVAPILFKKGVPATFFINSGFADNATLFYRHHASLAIEEILQKGKLTDLLKTEILSCKYDNKEKLFQYYSHTKVDDFLNHKKPYVTTEQIQILNKQGFTIGAHSVDHPYYYQISFDEQLRQTRESIDFVSSTINQKLKLFAFPFTDFNVSKNFFDEIITNIDLCFGTAGLKNDEIFFNIQRINGENLKIESILKNEYLKYMAKYFLKRNRIFRT